MSFLQRLRASLGGGAPQPGSPAAAAAAAQAAAARAAIAEAAEDLVDVRFRCVTQQAATVVVGRQYAGRMKLLRLGSLQHCHRCPPVAAARQTQGRCSWRSCGTATSGRCSTTERWAACHSTLQATTMALHAASWCRLLVAALHWACRGWLRRTTEPTLLVPLFMQQVSREMLFAFFDRFTAAFASWQPDPSTILAARAAAAAAAAAADVSKGGPTAAAKPRAHLQLVTGCSGGHPRALLAAAVESLERAPRAFAAAAAEVAAVAPWQPASPTNQAAELAAEQEAAVSTPGSDALLQAGGQPVLHALCLLVRSAHNRAILSELGLLPALAELVRMLGQKLQSAAAVLALQQGDSSGSGNSSGVRSSSPGPTGSRSSSPVRSPSRASLARAASSGQPQLLLPLLVLLREALAAVQAYAQHEAAQQQLDATRGSQVGSKAVSHAAQAAAQQAASASAAAAAASQTAAALAPLVARGLPASCCQLLPVLRLVRLHTDIYSQPTEQQAAAAAALLECVWSLEQQLLRTLLGLCSASPAGAAAALQQQGGTPLQQVAELVGWPLAAVDRQLPVSTASPGSSSSLAAGRAGGAEPASGIMAQQQRQQQQQAQQPSEESDEQTSSSSSSYVRVCCGAGLRPAEQEVQLQLLALRVLGAAARSGGSSCLRLLQQQGAFARLTQSLQWAALTFGADAAPTEVRAAAAAAAKPVEGPTGSPLAQLFGVLWGWLAGGSGGTALMLLPLLLQAQLAAFQPAGGEGLASNAAAGGSSGDSSSSQLFHSAALAALWGSDGSTGGTGARPASGGDEAAGDPGTALQQQVLLFAARLLGREQRLLPLLPAAAGQAAAAAAAADGGVGSSQALSNLQALRSIGKQSNADALLQCKLIVLGMLVVA